MGLIEQQSFNVTSTTETRDGGSLALRSFKSWISIGLSTKHGDNTLNTYAINKTAYPSLIKLSHVKRKSGELGQSSATVYLGEPLGLLDPVPSWRSSRSLSMLARIIEARWRSRKAVESGSEEFANQRVFCGEERAHTQTFVTPCFSSIFVHLAQRIGKAHGWIQRKRSFVEEFVDRFECVRTLLVQRGCLAERADKVVYLIGHCSPPSSLLPKRSQT